MPRVRGLLAFASTKESVDNRRAPREGVAAAGGPGAGTGPAGAHKRRDHGTTDLCLRAGGLRAGPRGPAAAEALRRERAYVADNAARLDYPRFVDARLPIGSGAVESLCKTLIGARAKGAGMRWTRAGLQAVGALRAVRACGSVPRPAPAARPRPPRRSRSRPPRPHRWSSPIPRSRRTAPPRHICGGTRPSAAPAVLDALTIVGRAQDGESGEKVSA